MPCENPECDKVIERPRPNQRFCSDACRAAGWRDLNIPHCPHCGGSLTVLIAPFKRTGE